jgi:hypothetical protein
MYKKDILEIKGTTTIIELTLLSSYNMRDDKSY